jgi:hypothetical protein
MRCRADTAPTEAIRPVTAVRIVGVCMRARWVLSLLLGLGTVGCSGIAPSAIPTGQAAIPTAAPVPTRSPTTAAAARSPTPTLEPTSEPTPEPTPLQEPPKPTGVAFDEQKRLASEASATEVSQTITWEAPLTEDVEIQVYGVTECLARPDDPAPDTTGPCLVTGTALPASLRTLLATAPASEGEVSWTWTGDFECGPSDPSYDPAGPAYFAIVLAAYNTAGHSIFAIAAPGMWWEPGPEGAIC